MIWKDIDLAYLAGFIDGEGSISIFHSGGRDHLRFDVYNTNEVTLLWAQNLFGGKIHKLTRTRLKWKQEYSWSAGHQHAAIILTACLPYLKMKRRHAELFIAYALSSKDRAGKAIPEETLKLRKEILIEMKQLNQRGVPSGTPRTDKEV